MSETTTERTPDAEVTNPNTKRQILKALEGGLIIVYSYDELTDRLYVYLE